MRQSAAIRTPTGVSVARPASRGYEHLLSTEGLSFVADLARTFGPRLAELLERRKQEQARLDAGESPAFLSETTDIRDSDWSVFPVRGDLLDRRVEMVRPPNRADIIEGLNSDANVFVADFDDASIRTWEETLEGQLNLLEATHRTISVKVPVGEPCSLRHRVAVLFVRPRGWEAVEPHLSVDGRGVPGALLDFGLFFFHNAKEQLRRCTAPYFYLPSLQNYLEARLWNDVFVYAQRAMGIAQATIKAACLIETLPAQFQMDEFLWELREHSCGLHRGRQRLSVGVVKRLVRTCHRRNTHAMGGSGHSEPPSARAPVVEPPVKPDLEKLRAEKLREVRAGMDGTWVAHPSLVPIAKQVFDSHMPGPNQIGIEKDPLAVEGSAEDGGRPPTKPRTERLSHWPITRGA
jgi:malate synthase